MSLESYFALGKQPNDETEEKPTTAKEKESYI